MADDNGTVNAVEFKVINGHPEQKTINRMMLPYPKLKNKTKFGHT
jgi:hypothetical protein